VGLSTIAIIGIASFIELAFNWLLIEVAGLRANGERAAFTNEVNLI
jgi:hypothetical protein